MIAPYEYRTSSRSPGPSVHSSQVVESEVYHLEKKCSVLVLRSLGDVLGRRNLLRSMSRREARLYLKVETITILRSHAQLSLIFSA